MGIKRSSLQLALDVLDEINGGETKPTRIMNAVRLSWRSLKEILFSLVSQGLVEEVEREYGSRSSRYYTITSRGQSFLECFSKINDLMKVR